MKIFSLQQSFRVCDVRGLRSSGMFRSVSGWFVVNVSGHLPAFNGHYVRKERNFFVDILTLDDDTDTVSRNVGNEQAWRSWPLKMGPIRCPETSVSSYSLTLQNIPLVRSVSGWFVVNVSAHLTAFSGQYVRKEINFFVDILTLDDDIDTVSRNVGNEQAWRSWPLKMGPIRCPETSVKNKHGDLDPWRWYRYGVPKRRHQATHWRCRTSH